MENSMTFAAPRLYRHFMPFSLVSFLQALAAGVLVGSAYALMCVGLGIIFGAMRVINFAQGDFLMVGMYAAFYLAAGVVVAVPGFAFTVYGIGVSFPGFQFFSFAGLNATYLGPSAGPIVAAFLAGPIVFALGWLLHRFVVARVTGASASLTAGEGAYGQILTTLGISLILQNGGLIVFGSTPVGIRTPLSRSSWEIGDVLLNQGRCVSFLVAVGLAVAMYLFLGHTRQGKGLRAAADNSQAALYMGIDVDKAHRIAWSLGVGITAIAGGLVAGSQSFQPYTGFDFVIVMYAGVVLGGLGSILGAFWGGLVIGIVQQMSTLVLPYQLQNTAIFVVFLLIVFLRPQGMFGRLSERT
jgi:branched-chain amino acid transport system permease protein